MGLADPAESDNPLRPNEFWGTGLVLNDGSRLFHRFDAGDSRDVRLEVSLDPHLESQMAGRASDACAQQADPHNALWGDPNELEVSTIGLHCRPNGLQDSPN